MLNRIIFEEDPNPEAPIAKETPKREAQNGNFQSEISLVFGIWRLGVFPSRFAVCCRIRR
jgi:hypothetical protein